MSPQRVAGNTAFLSLLLAWDFAVAAYLIAMPRQTFLTSPVWQDAARLIPSHDPSILGLSLAFGAFIVLVAHALHAPVIADGVGHVLIITGWGLMAASFVSAAFANHGLGYMTATASVVACLSHAGILYYRR